MKPILYVLAALFMSAVSFGQNTTTNTMKTPEDPFMLKGFRVGYVKPFLSWGIESKRGNYGGYLNEEFNGVTVGYGQIPVGSVGIIGGATLFAVKVDGEDIHLLRLDGNAAYAFNKYVFAKAGLNLSKFTKIPNNQFDPSIGGQVGLGIQFTKNIGLDLGLSTMRQSFKAKSYSRTDDSYSETEETIYESFTGIETGLTATF